MSGPADRRGGWRIEFGTGTRRPGAPGGPRGPRGPLRPTGGGGNGDGDGEDPGPLRPPLSARARRIALIVLLIAIVLIAIFFRPLLHVPAMWIWRTPLPWIAAIVVLLIGRLLGNRQKLTVADLQAGRYPGRGLWASSFAVAGLVFFVLQAINPILVQRAMATHTTFTPAAGLPDVGKVRLVPREVADAVLNGSLNSSIDRLTDLAVINTPTGLQWSAIRTPQGVVRRYTKKSDGFVLLDAENIARKTTQVTQQFKYAPGLAIFDSLTWQLRKKNLLVDLTSPVGILDAQGKPLILVPYLKYVGFPIRRPKLGGAYVVHPNGQIETLSVAQALKRPEIVASGRLYPDVLSRKQMDSYAIRGGIWNYLFLHKNQTKIVDTEINRQPYLLQGPDGSTMWVATAEPYGSGQATNAIFMQDSTTGKMSIWNVPGTTQLTGNVRALSAARSKPISGVTFTSTDALATGSGGFRTVEPRPVTIKDKLYFVVSVIPDNANNTSATVFVDTTNNQAAAVCYTNASTQAFLMNGPASSDDADQTTSDCTSAGASSSTTDGGVTATTPASTTPTTGGTKRLSSAQIRQAIDDALAQQKKLTDQLEALRRQLGTTP
ncbi:MAG: hypothetical protein AAGC46_18220 [Solirubrobacteraceae bacterium]|nr:hypothetical protein [Patulibacter sp.]